MARTSFTRLRSKLNLADLWGRDYLASMVKIAIPIALQNLIMSSLNLANMTMIGQLGETSIAAVGLGNQITFLLSLAMFGITSGSAMFTAQLWGKGDIPNLRKVLGLCLTLAVSLAAVFFSLSFFFPQFVLGIYTADQAVIGVGSQYLRLLAGSYLLMAVSFSLASVLRSTGEVRVPLFVSLLALGLNTVLSLGFILGYFGFPVLGVRGAALAILAARTFEMVLLIFLVYRLHTPIAARLSELFSFNLDFAKTVLRRSLPVAVNEILWSLGITTYNIIYARIGTDSLASVNIVSSIENLGFTIFIGIADATAILVGNRIGANEEKQAHEYAGKSLALGVLLAMVMGAVLRLGAVHLIDIYKVAPEVAQNARNILTIVGFTIWVRVTNMIIFVGILRSGGDTRFAFVVDSFTVWLVGVPLAAMGAFLLHLPIYLVVLLVMVEEFVKWGIGLRRYFSRKWIHNLAEVVEAIE